VIFQYITEVFKEYNKNISQLLDPHIGKLFPLDRRIEGFAPAAFGKGNKRL